MQYCPQLSLVLQRLRRWLVDRDQSIVLARIEVPNRVLREFRRTNAPGLCEAPDPAERIAFWDQVLRHRIGIHDDSIPSVYLTEMDQGLYGGLIGAQTHFNCDPESGWISSMVIPPLRDLTHLEDVPFLSEGEWMMRYLRFLEIYRSSAAGRFGVSHFILINGLNFVFELEGATQTLIDMIQRPELVRQATELAFEISCRVQEIFFDHVDLIEGGTCSNIAQWVPGRIVSESIDPFHLTSPKYFDIWGREQLERVFSRFDGGVLHIHGNGRHLLECVRDIRLLRAVWLGDDRNYPPACDVINDLRHSAGDLPLVCQTPFEYFVNALENHRLTGGVFYHITGCPDDSTANRLMDKVREYQA